jgi:hypothetical protein
LLLLDEDLLLLDEDLLLLEVDLLLLDEDLLLLEEAEGWLLLDEALPFLAAAVDPCDN